MSAVSDLPSPKLRPLRHWVLIEYDVRETWSAGVIQLQDHTVEENVSERTGTVVAVGPGEYCEKSPTGRLPMFCRRGDRVLFRGFLRHASDLTRDLGGLPWMREGKLYSLIVEKDLLAIVDDPDITFGPYSRPQAA